MLQKKIALQISINVINYILSFVTLIIISRYFGPTSIGVIAYIGGFIGILSIFTTLGFDQAHVKRISEGMDLGRCIGTFILIQLILTTIVIFISAILFFNIFHFDELNYFQFDGTEKIVFLILLIGLIFTSIIRIPQLTFSARLETAKANFPVMFGKIGYLLSGIIIALYFRDIIYLAINGIVPLIIILILYIILFRNYPIKKPSKEFLSSYLKFGIPLAIIPILGLIQINIDKIMIGIFINTTEVGYYYIPQRIRFALGFIALSVTSVLFPVISKLYKKKDINRINYLVEKSEKYLALVFFSIAVVVLAYAEEIISLLFGEDFSPAGNIFRIFILSLLFFALNVGHLSIITGTGHPKLLGILSVILVPLNIILNFIFIPKQILGIKLLGMGAVGAALSTSVTGGIGFFLIRYWVKNITNYRQKKHILLHLFAAVITISFLLVLKLLIPISSYLHLIVFSWGGLGAYLYLLYLLKEFRKEDAIYLSKVISPFPMFKYIMSELKSKD